MKLEAFLYWTKLYERYAYVGSGQTLADFSIRTPLVINDEGVMIYSTEPIKTDILPEEVYCDTRDGLLIHSAKSPEAMAAYLDNHPHINKGDIPAIWTSPDEPIVQLPHCDQYYRTRDGGAQCGPPGLDGKSALGACFLHDNVDPTETYWTKCDCKVFELLSDVDNAVDAGLAQRREIGDYAFIIPEPWL